MALQTSGQISLNDIHVEAGGSSGSQATINDSDIRGLISKGSGVQMSFSEWYGASASQSFTISSNQTNLNLATWLSSNGWNGTSTAIVTVNSGVWIYSTSTSYYGLEITSTLNGKLQLLNYGNIIGMGANGGSSSAGGNGQAAIRNTATGISITNYSGAYIAGGGGGGGGYYWPAEGFYVGGGGGAGGGNGAPSAIYSGGAGGGINSSGAEGGRRSGPDSGFGGGAGGEGGSGGGGGGGGRILPGTGGSGRAGGDGGSGGSAGGSSGWGGGGGGWGASGGSGGSYAGGSGGAAISSTQSYTLSNSGTIYGST